MAVKRFHFFGSYSSFRPFIFKVNSGSSGTYTIPTSTTYTTYDYSVKVQGTSIWVFGQTGNYTITFPATNTDYIIEISGVFPKIHSENYTGVFDIIQWGEIKWQDFVRSFRNMPLLTQSATDSPDLSECENINEMFRESSGWNANLNNWNMSNIENMLNMMIDCPAYDNGGVTLDWSSPITGTINAIDIHAFAYRTALAGYKLQAGNVQLVSFNNNFTNSATLSELIGMKSSFTISAAPITGSAIDDLFTSLGTANSGATITLTTAQSTSGIDTTIATLKGWTIIVV